jgi:hypothetical protein
MATTAVVAGTANAVSHKQAQRYANQAGAQQQAAAAANQQQMADMQAQMTAMQAQQATAAAAPAGGADVMAQLQQLAQMKEQGLLSDEQFEAAKSKLLGV